MRALKSSIYCNWLMCSLSLLQSIGPFFSFLFFSLPASSFYVEIEEWSMNHGRRFMDIVLFIHHQASLQVDNIIA